MQKDFSKLQIGVPDLGDRGTLLKTLGTIVAKEIVAMINREEQPDGSPQKQNSEDYRKYKLRKKGYTTPLWGTAGGAMSIAYHKSHGGKGGKSTGVISPYLARSPDTAPTFLRTLVSDDTLIIHLNSKRDKIGEYLTRKGYWFMGITDRAERQIMDRVTKWKDNKIAQMRRKVNG